MYDAIQHVMLRVTCTCNANTLRVTCNALQVTCNEQTLTRNVTRCRRHDTKLWVKGGVFCALCSRGGVCEDASSDLL